MNVRLLLLLVLFPFGSVFSQTEAQPTLPTTMLVIGRQSVKAEVADDDAERATGMMFRESLDDGSGMLFVMPSIGPAAFWMRNTKIPLSIAFISPDGVIAEIHEMQAMSEKRVRSMFPNVAYALEMPAGWFSRKNIWPGERVIGLPKHPQAGSRP